MMHNWSIAKSRRTATFNEASERRHNPLISRQKEISVKLKGEGEVKVDLKKVYLNEQAFLEIESSLDGSENNSSFNSSSSEEIQTS
jgi:hypothetical protein